MKNLLHLCSDYSNQKLYKNLVQSISKFNIKQVIFVPVRNETEVNKYNITDKLSIKIIYKHILKKYHRILYHLKIKTSTTVLKKEIDVSDIDIIHAHFLFSDGGVALKLKKEFNTPYVVSVRNTDVNMFFKYMVHLRKKGVEILSEASQIIYLNEAYKNQVLNTYIPQNKKEKINKKSIVIPNGINDFWLENKAQNPLKKNQHLNLIYVGDFTANKNVPAIIQATKELNNEIGNVSLTIVGGGGNQEDEIKNILNNTDEKVVRFVGRVTDKTELKALYASSNLFIMPSFKETFGIVYLEAMSQGLPILYSKGQGVDGYFNTNQPGYSVNPDDLSDIKNKIIKAKNNLNELSKNALFHIDSFSWANCSKKLYNEYQNAFNKNT